MKININYLENNIILLDNYIFAIEIENKNYFYRIINELNMISNGNEVGDINFFDEDGKEINLSNKINLIIDYFNIDFNSKKILNSLYKSIKDNIDEEIEFKINSSYKRICELISKTLTEYDFPLVINDEFDFDNIFKLLKVSINCKNNLLDNLLLLIDIENLFKINQLLIFINLKSYLSNNELIEFCKYSIYNEIKVILIDFQCYGTTLQNEKKLIIDSNLDEFLL